MENHQYFRDLLHNRDLKATNPRISLLSQMHNYAKAMPHSAIQKAMKSIDRVTLYRTIESLTGQGVIHKAFQENNEVYYAICSLKCDKNHHHHDHVHFKCVKCDSVTCEQLDKVVDISLPEYDIHKTSIHLEGICKLCKREFSTN